MLRLETPQSSIWIDMVIDKAHGKKNICVMFCGLSKLGGDP